MSAETHTRNMLLRSLSLLWERIPTAEFDLLLARFGFRPGDVTFRYPSGDKARRWAKRNGVRLPRCEVKAWPWERASDVNNEAVRVAQGRAESETQE